VPWRGPRRKGEYPSLGYEVGDWIEDNLIVPDGTRQGRPYLLTDEMWRHILQTYRLIPDATPEMGSLAFQYYGAALIRPQKWGKDPLGAARVCAEALGPVRFAGWDAAGEPVGMPMPTPWIQCAGNAEEQTDNTFRPIVAMLRGGPVSSTPGLDVGESRINLPDGGRIEPVTASARARLGARLTFFTLTESHLMTETSGGLKMARAMKRNAAGMDGRWLEITNAWDPGQGSVAQLTYQAKAPGVYIDYRPPRGRIDLDDDAALSREVEYVYGDSSISRGGWVRPERIIAEIRDPATGEGEARRFFLNEISVGSSDAVDMIKWVAQARGELSLKPGDQVALGFHGSQNRDSTSLVAARLSDGFTTHLRTWDKPIGAPSDWVIPRPQVHEAVQDAFTAYDVIVMFAAPHGWQDELDTWSGLYDQPPTYQGEERIRIMSFPLNSEARMDAVIERFTTAHRAKGENEMFTHDGCEELSRAAAATALAHGKRRPSAEERAAGMPEYYQRVVRKDARTISPFVAALLALEGRGWALEHGHGFGDTGGFNIW